MPGSLITDNINGLKELLSKIENYKGGDGGLQRLKEALQSKLEWFERFSTRKAHEMHVAKDPNLVLVLAQEAINTASIFLSYRAHVKTATHKNIANIYHRIANCCAVVAQVIQESQPFEALRYRELAYEYICDACEFDKEHPQHQQRRDTYKENLRVWLDRLTYTTESETDKQRKAIEKDAKDASNGSYHAQREKTIDLNEKLLKFAEKFSNESKYQLLVSKSAQRLAFHYSGIAIETVNPNSDDQIAHSIYKTMIKAFNYIELACRVSPEFEANIKFRTHLAVKYIGFIWKHSGVLIGMGNPEALTALQFLYRLQTILNSPAAEQANTCHALSSLYLQLKSNSAIQSQERLHLIEQAYSWAEKAYNLDSGNRHHRAGFVFVCEAYGKTLIESNPAKAKELFKKSIELNKLSDSNVLDPKALIFCIRNLARLELDQANAEKNRDARVALLKSSAENFALVLKIRQQSEQPIEEGENSDAHMLSELHLIMGLELEKTYNEQKQPNPELLRDAERHYIQSAHISGVMQDTRKLGVAYKRLGSFYKFFTKDEKKAAGCFRRGVELLIPALKEQGTLSEIDNITQQLLKDAEEAWNNNDYRKAMHGFLEASSKILTSSSAQHRQQFNDTSYRPTHFHSSNTNAGAAPMDFEHTVSSSSSSSGPARMDLSG